MNEPQAVTYRFNLRDRTGWFLGLEGPQCVALGLGVLGAGALLNAGAPGLTVFVPLVLAAAIALGQWQGRPLYLLAPIATTWSFTRLTGRHRWFAPITRFTESGERTTSQPSLPPMLEGTSIDESEVAWTRRGRSEGTGIVLDRTERTATAVLRVSSRAFALAERGEQQRMLSMWGDALAAFCTERGPVAKIRWTEWAAPAGLDDQRRYLTDHQSIYADPDALGSYRELLASAGPMVTRHEVLVAVTVAERKLRRRNGDHDHASIDEVLLEEVRLLSGRLETAGLSASLPLSPTEIAETLRSRLDPYSVPTLGARKRSLTELAGIVSVVNAGPMSVDVAWDHVRVDRSVHASYVFAEWPRLEVGPTWMEPLMLQAGGIRTLAVHYEPVAHSRSQRQVDRDSVKLAADEEQRNRSGFRVGARHRRAQTEVADREAELVAGYPEFEYVGTAHICAPDQVSLERSCSEYEQLAAQVGIELRRLDGQHDLALACCLPIGRGIAGKRGLQ
ncbi:MAG: SCO6880 family protein [Acidimicrobiales bacterium]